MPSPTLSLFDDERASHTVGARRLPVLSEERLPGRTAALVREPAPSRTLRREDLRPSILDSAPRDRSLGGSRLTLDDVLVGAWEGLTSGRQEVVDCVVCGGPMEARWGATSLPVGGRCTSCRSTLF